MVRLKLLVCGHIMIKQDNKIIIYNKHYKPLKYHLGKAINLYLR